MVMRLCVVCLCMWSGAGAYAQTTTNPDISAVGDFRIYGHNDPLRSDEADDLNIASPELELNIGGCLNHHMHIDAVLAWHGEHAAEIEELYATIEDGLPLASNLRIGKYLLEFGQLNPLHPHDYSFIERPLVHEVLFGVEGLNDVAIRNSFLLPSGDAHAEFMAGLLKGDALTAHAHEHEAAEKQNELANEEEPTRDLAFFGRLAASLAVTDAAELSFGGSVLNAVHGFHYHDTESDTAEHYGEPEQLRAWLIGGDVKYNYMRDDNTALQIEAEAIMSLSEQAEGIDDLFSYGGYGYIDYRFRQRYNLGGILEWISLEELHEDELAGTGEIQVRDTWRAGLFVGWAPVDEASIVRLAGHWTDPDEGDGYWEVILQWVICLGPHDHHDH